MPREWSMTWRVPCLRGIAPQLRRARLLAARKAGPGAARRAILAGHWDRGNIVRKHLSEQENTI